MTEAHAESSRIHKGLEGVIVDTTPIRTSTAKPDACTTAGTRSKRWCSGASRK